MHVLLIPAELIHPVDRIAGATLARLEEGLRLWREGGFDLLAVSGGVFLPPDVQTRSAANLMEDWLAEHGVNRSDILVEDESLDTFQNIALTYARLGGRAHGNSLEWTVVSHSTHLRRFAVTCRTYGITMHRAPVAYRLSLGARIGEAIAYLVHRLDPRGVGHLARRNRAGRMRRTWKPAALMP